MTIRARRQTKVSNQTMLIDGVEVGPPKQPVCWRGLNRYEGCSNMNASSFITFFTYMLRHNVIPFWKELFVVFKMAPNIKKHSLYVSGYRRLYKSHSYILKFFEANCNTRFGTCADIVSYLCKFETKWHQILDAS